MRETAAILAMVAAVDSRRSFGQIDAQAWHAFIGDFTFDDCREAVIGHYKESPHSITPSDINTRIIAARRARIGNRVAPVPPIDPSDARGYADWVVAWMHAVADGLTEEEATRRADSELGVIREAIAMSQRTVDLTGIGREVK
jgi:hypothetical protein